MNLDIAYLLNNLTLEEKAGLCSGANFWFTKAVDRLGIPAIMVTDGPHGLRKQNENADHLGLEESVKAVCFPSGSALASSFDRELMKEVGRHLGEAARAEKVHTLLGPAVNIKRSPLCGRNFEYLSEDPYLAGEMATSYVQGVQSCKVGTSIKHFAANNQEMRRMSISVRADERTLREIYLAAFEKIVTQAKPWTIMCSYNRINGVYSCENDWLLNKVLREEWGFDGIVMTDWGAMNNRCKALKAGLNLEMPASYGINDALIIEAINNGELDVKVLDKTVKELLEWVNRGVADGPEISSYDKEKHHAFSRFVAEESAVLLKNRNGLLPLKKTDKIAFIGTFAEKPRYQGGGSSHINSFKTVSALEAAKNIKGIVYAPGFEADGVTANLTLLHEAVEAARNSKVTVIFAGLPDSYESEGYDRTHLNLPECQNDLITRVSNVQPNTVVILHKGSSVTMPWVEDVASIIDMYLGGQAVGEAEINLLFGDANPCGKLAETYPLRLEDTPSYLDFPGNDQEVNYGEGLFVGYRWYDARQMDVLFPFGHGLSYTSFSISNLRLSSGEIKDTEELQVTVSVKNTGSVFGKEVVQIYVAPLDKQDRPRPGRELKGFVKIALEPGEEKTVTFTLSKRSFAYYETKISDWLVESGSYRIFTGVSSRNLPLYSDVRVLSTQRIPFKLQDNTTFSDVLRYYDRPEALNPILDQLGKAFGMINEEALGEGTHEMIGQMIDGMPLHSICSFIPVGMSDIRRILEIDN